MYTYLKLKNFRTFDDISIDFKKTEKDINKFLAIYGENGSGKTSIVLAFNLLKDALMSLIYENFISENTNGIPNNIALMQLKNAIRAMDFTKTAKNVKMLNSDDSTEVEYGFSINGIEGYYNLKFNEELESETLYYLTNKNRGILFEIKRNENGIVKTINNMFSNETYKDEISVEIDKFWGKHTLIAILVKELQTKNKKFIEERTSENLLQVIDELLDQTVVYVATPNNFVSKSNNTNKNLSLNLDSGIIHTNMEEQLNISEKVLKEFFTQAYPDVKDVFYKRQLVGNNSATIKYDLYFKKNICGKLIDIPFPQESTGTRQLINIFNSLMGVLFGKTVIIDEIDNGIHDILMKTIIESIKEDITGQLIITTHNTLLLESLDKYEIYVITTDFNGRREINPVSKYDFKIQKNNNIRDLYLKGAFGGVPFIDYIDFNEIKQDLETAEQ